MEIGQHLPVVMGNPVLLRQIFRNLIENGVEHNRSEPKTVRVSSYDEEGHVVVDVTDNGMGIPEKLADNMFTPHIRRGGSKGSGMGLAIVKRACDSQGIEISLDSAIGSGTTFHLRFTR
jgi:signal transduction histidine kinase